MKKFIKILALIFLLLILAAVAIPYLFKDKIIQAVKRDINRNLTAQVDFGDTDMSLFRHFPDLYVEINDISVINKDSTFQDIPLARIGKFGLTLDLSALWKGRKEIKDIYLGNADFMVYVTKDGRANYDIVKSSGEEKPEESGEGLEMHLQHYKADQVRVLYDDRSLGMKMYLSGLRHEGATHIDGDRYLLTGQSLADTLDVTYDGIRYLNNTKVNLNDTIEIANEFSRFHFRNISGTINDLPLYFKGLIVMKKNDDIDMNLAFGTRQQSSLAQLLSLVPAAYMPDMPQMDIRGKAALQGSVRGTYNEKNYPAYHIAMDVRNGRIKGKDLPESIDHIKLDTRVDFPGGADLDATVIDMPVIAFSVAGNQAQGRLNVRHPMTDPLVDTRFKAGLNLGDFKKALPMKTVRRLEGFLQTDFAIKARISDMEKQRTERIKATGYFNLKDFAFEDDSLPYPIAIPKAETSITPTAWKLDRMQLQAGRSDFDINGEMKNYLAYFTGKDSALVARFRSRSHLIDANELMAASGDEDQSGDTASIKAPRIPKNLDIALEALADTLIYKDMDLSDTKAKISVAHQKAKLETVLMKAFGGQIAMNGTYDTSGELPYTSMKLDMKKLNVDQTAQTLTLLQHYAPILEKIKGYLDMGLQMGLNVDENLNPILQTTDAQGQVATGKLQPQNVGFFKSAANVLQLKALENPVIDKAQARFAINDGTLNVKPFDFKVNGMKSSLGGKVMLDQSLDLDWNLEIPVEKLGAGANQWLQRFQGELQKLGLKTDEIKTIYVTLKISGDVRHPKIRPVFRRGQGSQGLVETVKETVVTTVKEEAQQVIDSTKQVVDQKAQELIRQAEEQGDALIREAEDAAARLRAEADKQAKELEAKASNPIEKYAARKAGEKIKKEADRKAKQLIEKAKQQKQKLIDEAKRKAEQLRQTDTKLQ